MLVQCPKCGFEQPQDEYCANCGVNMLTYRPPKGKTLSSWLKNPATWLPLLIVTAGLIALFEWREKTQREQELKTYRELPASRRDRNVRISPPTEEASERTPRAKEQSRLAETSENQPSLEPEGLPTEEDVRAKPKEQPNPAKQIKKASVFATNVPPQIRFELAEVNRQLFNLLEQSGRTLAGYNEYKILHFDRPTWQKVLQQREDYNSYPLAERNPRLSLEGTPSFENFAIPDPRLNEDLGLFFRLALTQINKTLLTVEMEIQRKLRMARQDELTIDQLTLQDELSVPPGSVIVLTGLLPRQSLSAQETEVYQGSLFEVMLSEEFRSGATHLVAILHFPQGG